MSQNDFTIANQGFPAFRADLNSALQALASNSSGATAPSTTFANMWWYDSANNIMYIRNEDNDAWIKFAELDQTNDKFVLSGTLQLDDGTVSAPALTFNSDTNMGIYRGGTDILKFVTAGTDAITIDASQNTTFAGTLTASGLTVNGTNVVVADLNTTNSNADITLDNVSYGVRLRTSSAGAFQIMPSDNTYLNVAVNGDISFYEDTGSTPKFSWSSSNETIAIGLGASSTATISAYSRTVSAGLPSALRIIENTGASTYWDIGANNGASPNLNFYVNGNTSPKMTLSDSGNLTLTGSLGSSSMPSGSVIQVLQGVKTDTFVSSASVTDTDITGLTVSITPRSTSSKILVICNLGIAAENAQGGATKLKRTIGGTSTQLSLADTAGSRSRGSFAGSAYRGSAASHTSQLRSQHLTYLDSPSTTSAITYGVQVSSITVGTYINRTGTDTDSVDRYRGVSYITVMEIQG